MSRTVVLVALSSVENTIMVVLCPEMMIGLVCRMSLLVSQYVDS